MWRDEDGAEPRDDQTRAIGEALSGRLYITPLVTEGLVGAILNLAPRTVAAHKYRMMEVLRVRSSAELVQFAVKAGVVA